MPKLSEKKIINKIKSIDFNAHWYRRVFHVFGASFLFYYMLPDSDWINLLKFWIPPFIVIFAIILEILRIKGKISSKHFFGLRMYEQKRIGSYVFFGVGILILLRFFPQQIAIPCILCACIGDPIIGEVRNRFGNNYVYLFGFFVCMFFFLVSWYKASVNLMIIVGVVGAIGAIIGETQKIWWLDDDFMIQILPGLLLLIIWFAIPDLGFTRPDIIIYPGLMPW